MRSGKKRKRSYVFRADDREVAAIQRGDDLEAEPLGERHDGCVDSPKGQIVIAGYELRDTHPIPGRTGAVVKFPDERSPRKRTSAFQPRRVSMR